MSDAAENMLADAGMSVSSCNLEMTYIEYNSVESITVPEEVLSAVGGKSEDDFQTTDPLDGDFEMSGTDGQSWESYTVQINGTTLTLPCSIEELESTGLVLDEDYTQGDYVIEPEEHDTAWFTDENGNSIMVDLSNVSDEPVGPGKCAVSSVYVYKYGVENGGLTVVFPGGIQIGSSESDVLGAYGEPDNSYEDEEYGNSYFWFEEGSYYNGCAIDISPDTGTVEYMSLARSE